MNEDQATLAIISFLKSSWLAKTEISWDNIDFKSTDNTPYIEPTITTVDSFSLSKSCLRNNCLLTIVVNTPKNTGINQGIKYSDDLLNLFVNKDAITGITFKSGRAQRLGPLGEWHRRRVLINFFYNQEIA